MILLHVYIFDDEIFIGTIQFEYNDQLTIGFEICRDSWDNEIRPANLIKTSKNLLILNPIASHYAFNKFEFRLNQGELEELKVGQALKLDIFKEGEHVDITGTTIGKGFQGGVKRHHFKTQDATHGNSLSHRALGSTGQCQDPGRVFKGKKMAGQLGNVRNTIQNLVIVKILLEENTILVKGSIPGHDGSDVIIKPTRKKYTPKEILTKQETCLLYTSDAADE